MSRINIFHINPFTAIYVHVVVTFEYVDKSYRDRRSAAQLCNVTETALKSPFLWVNVRPTRHGYRSRARGIRYGVEVTGQIWSQLKLNFVTLVDSQFSLSPRPNCLWIRDRKQIACSRLRDGKKKCEKRAGAGERQGGPHRPLSQVVPVLFSLCSF